MNDPQATDGFKRLAALAAGHSIQSGTIMGPGIGSRARHVLHPLREAVGKGLRIKGAPTSDGIATRARRHGIPHSENPDALGDGHGDRWR